MITDVIRKEIQKTFKAVFDWQPTDISITNPEPQFGDFSVSCHQYAQELKLSPQAIAQKLADAVASDGSMRAHAVAGHLNISVDAGVLAKDVLSDVINQDRHYGESTTNTQKILLEYSSPNTNKPLHLGHVRNNVLGMSLAQLLASQGAQVIKTQIINDRGIHIIKSMLAYQKWGHGHTPEEAGEKGDHFVGKFYVMFEREFEREWQVFLKDNPEVPGLSKEDAAKRRQEFFGESEIGAQAQEMLRKWESSDKDVMALWKQMNEWVYSGFYETYQELGSTFDKDYFESNTYLLGKKIIDEGIKKGVFYEEGGALWADLTDVGLDKKLVQRSDGTSVYVTQDFGLAVARQKEFGFDGMVYVVGHEQEYHFKVLFAILKKLGYAWASQLHHLSYGLVFLPEGKMKSREGKVVDADTIIAEVTSLAAEEVKKRFPELTDVEILERAETIGTGALKFFLLRVTPTQSIHFNPKEAIAFEGSTGPYVQYAHARITSILSEETPLEIGNIHFDRLNTPEEKTLVLKLLQYVDVISGAAEHYNPSAVCNYLIELSHNFNTFYHEHSVLKAESEELKHSRLLLISAVRIVLRNGLSLLNIKAPEKM
ncbi:arginine--tRNA ligase [bacterium CG10_46_32]|nr:MAG: arginine--tRNA ligase [bacterium CG10_46_32]PIR56220.1 MAG: arginine--tRNA ligase [Parcubacteria group bacterium CG10_big_fil_rev_8_21_14_0_10_46_32]